MQFADFLYCTGRLLYNCKKRNREATRVKNLIINIYKTLFFFDLSIVIAYYLPSVKAKNAAVSITTPARILFFLPILCASMPTGI